MNDIDPEVLRDMEIQRRPRQARHSDEDVFERISSWRPQIVTVAKCQAHAAGCQNTVGVTAEGLHALETFSAQLARKGEAPLDMNTCFPCADCYVVRSGESLKKSAARRERVTESIRYLKAASDKAVEEAMGYVRLGRGAPEWGLSDEPKAALDRLAFLAKVMGLGYVTDLVTTIRENRKSPGKAKPRAGDL